MLEVACLAMRGFQAEMLELLTAARAKIRQDRPRPEAT